MTLCLPYQTLIQINFVTGHFRRRRSHFNKDNHTPLFIHTFTPAFTPHSHFPGLIKLLSSTTWCFCNALPGSALSSIIKCILRSTGVCFLARRSAFCFGNGVCFLAHLVLSAFERGYAFSHDKMHSASRAKEMLSSTSCAFCFLKDMSAFLHN